MQTEQKIQQVNEYLKYYHIHPYKCTSMFLLLGHAIHKLSLTLLWVGWIGMY